MPIIRQVSQLGHQVLREPTKMVEDISSHVIQNLIDDMLITVKDYNGVGIAANQVYESLKIFVIASYPNVRYPHAPKQEPFALINPEIVWHSSEIIKGWEGCLSIPGIRGLVPRHKALNVKYTDRQGNNQEVELNDFTAIIFQHEFDHINGMVYLDRVETNRDIITEKEYLKLLGK